MPGFKPIKTPRVSQEVAEQLKQAILRGEFEPREKLPSEQRLAEQFQVSRLSVREALHKLESFGFVVTRQGITGGAYVIDLTFQTLANGFLDLFLAGKISIPELHQVRVVIEPEIARLAALNVTGENSRRLEEAYRAETQQLRTIEERFDARTGVHLVLAQVGGNRFFEAMLKSALTLTLNYVKVVDIGQEHMDRIHPLELHGPVVEAVLSGNADRAYEAMKTHAVEFGQILVNLEEVYRKKKSASQ
jgi:GntR family transcriptional regulator, transcriptional repressor for pyruvate dehydrogenase complex